MPCALVSFGFGGRLITMRPINTTPYYNKYVQPGQVVVEPVKDVLKPEFKQEFTMVSGPLMDQRQNAVLQYLDQSAEVARGKGDDDRVLLLESLKLMCRLVEVYAPKHSFNRSLQ